jgi:hypothetical protein
MTSTRTKVKISQAYLELARSYLDAVAHSKTTDVSNPDQQELDKQATTTFAFAALSTIFSYLAVEAFVNYELFHIWQHSRMAHDAIENIKKKDPSLKAVPIYYDFYKKYGHIEDFSKLKDSNLRELKERIKIVCEANGFPKIHDKDPALWHEFLDLLEDTRHALVHANPDDAVFARTAERVYSTDPYRKYPRIAADVIAYFFRSANAKVPEYLERNQLFLVSGIEIIY